MKKKLTLGIIVLISILCLLFVLGSLKNLIYNHQEKVAIKTYLFENGIVKSKDLKLDKQLAFQISDMVRRDFQIDETKWKYLKPRNESFLGYSCKDLLSWKEGKCGKGTRVIIKLLNYLGYDATRVTLYGKDLSSSTGHTLISVIIDGKEYFIDSVNSPEELNKALKEQDISASSFGLRSYKDRHDDSRNHQDTDTTSNAVTDYFILYGYDAIPFSKLFNVFRLDVRVFSFSRPGKCISDLSESVYKIKLYTMLTWLFIFGIINICFIRRYRRQMYRRL
jgi:hypothetical protein